MRVYKNLFEQIIDPENLFISWERFKKGKRNKPDVAKFEFNLEQNIFKLHRELKNKTYKHGSYASFYIRDPKVRHIHKAIVRDRIVHHAVFRILNMVFEPTFISNSFSCRIGKGNHKGVFALENMARKISRNYTKPCFVLKCDIKKFFDSVNHEILLSLLERKIKDKDTIYLLRGIINSYSIADTRERERVNASPKKGIPIGNLTSQIFANIYMNELDQFVKHKLKVKHYLRYTDDFVIIARNEKYLQSLLPKIKFFLAEKLHLNLHPDKIIFRKYLQGIDFLGYVIRPYYKLPRTKTKRRLIRKLYYRTKEFQEGKIGKITVSQALYSYLGLLSHANTHKFSENLKNQLWFWLNDK